MTQPSDRAIGDAGFGERIRSGRSELLANRGLGGRRLTRALADQMDGWFHRLGSGLGPGWALAATGGYGRAQLFPGSDVDVVLIHPRQVSQDAAAEAARTLWYPMWDGGVKLSPAVHSERTLMQLAGGDLATSTALLDIRHLAGDRAITHQVGRAAHQQWQKRPWMWLAALRAANEQRWGQAGDVSARLEPNLKDGRGGLRDVDAFRWALAVRRDDVTDALDLPTDDLVLGAADLVDARAEVHRITGRATNILLLQDQDAVAEACGAADADALMIGLSAAARQIEWASDRFWAEIDLLVERGGSPRRGGAARAVPLTAEAVVRDGEVELTADAGLDDQSLTFRVAAAAAHGGHRLARSTLLQLAGSDIAEGAPWGEPTRRAFLSLLGSGPALVTAVDTLEFHGLFSRFLPEWRAIYSRPQRNAFHLYTVDRHLLQTVVEAGRLVRSVSRPDLLLTAALLHDIGKGRTEDHTDLGVRLTVEIAERMGFATADVDVLSTLVRCHLLLPETATRRDLDDPLTAEQVAAQVGSATTLTLLRALTEADSRATGPTSWTPWKQRLVDSLVVSTAATFRGDAATAERAPLTDGVGEVAARAADGGLHVRYWPGSHGDAGVVAVATPDRAGLFATIAGAFALHGVSVLSADVWTTADRLAVDQFQVIDADEVHWARVEQFIRRAMSGEVDLDERIRQRLAAPRLRRRADAAAAPVTEIQIRNDASTTATMIDVRSPDAEAVLYRLAVVLRDHGLDIQSAKVATLGHEVVDVFYVQHNGAQIGEHAHESLSADLARVLAG